MNAQCGVRRARADDIPAVLAIERECAEVSHWSEATWRGMMEHEDRAEHARVVFLVEEAGQVLGFAVAQSAAGNAELEGVAVRPEARRRGVARALCRAVIEWAVAQCAASEWAAEEKGAAAAAGPEQPWGPVMHLEVRAGNAAALGLYAQLGFLERGRRKDYYRDPVEDAVVMARPLNGLRPKADGVCGGEA